MKNFRLNQYTKEDKRLVKNVNKIQDIIADRVWGVPSPADFSAKDVFRASLVRMNIHSTELDTDIERLTKQSTVSVDEVTQLIQKHIKEINYRLDSSQSKFIEYFNHYSGRESVIVMCLFNAGQINLELKNKVEMMFEWYISEQSTDWASMNGSICGRADIDPSRALSWFLENVALTGALWDLTRKTISHLLKQARNITKDFYSYPKPLTEVEMRLCLLGLSDEEIEELSSHLQKNLKQFFLNLNFTERSYINVLLSEEATILSNAINIPPTLNELEYICTIEQKPQEISIVLFPKCIRFFQSDK